MPVSNWKTTTWGHLTYESGSSPSCRPHYREFRGDGPPQLSWLQLRSGGLRTVLTIYLWHQDAVERGHEHRWSRFNQCHIYKSSNAAAISSKLFLSYTQINRFAQWSTSNLCLSRWNWGERSKWANSFSKAHPPLSSRPWLSLSTSWRNSGSRPTLILKSCFDTFFRNFEAVFIKHVLYAVLSLFGFAIVNFCSLQIFSIAFSIRMTLKSMYLSRSLRSSLALRVCSILVHSWMSLFSEGHLLGFAFLSNQILKLWTGYWKRFPFTAGWWVDAWTVHRHVDVRV